MRTKIIILTLSILLILPLALNAASIIDTVRGKILLQVEENGEAWYVNPENDRRYFMGRPQDAFDLMRNLGLGIANEHLNQIPIGLIAQSGTDTDRDGLVDLLETAIGTNMYSNDTDNDGYEDKTEIENWYYPTNSQPMKMPVSKELIDLTKGKILLQVQDHGEAWYVNPTDNKRYFLGRPIHAFEIMRNLGLGITNADLQQITIAN